jgi:hypothetical protein
VNDHYKVPVFDEAYKARMVWNERGSEIGKAMLAALQEKHFVAQPYGPDGCGVAFYRSRASNQATTAIVVRRSAASSPTDVWLRATIEHILHLPTPTELAALHLAVFGAGTAYQIYPTQGDSFAVDLWGLESGEPALPKMGMATARAEVAEARFVGRRL